MEEFRIVAKRGLDFLEELIVEYTNNRILIVSHGVSQLQYSLPIILDCANLMSPKNHLHQEAIITEALKLLGNRIAVIHLKDFIVKDGAIQKDPLHIS